MALPWNGGWLTVTYSADTQAKPGTNSGLFFYSTEKTKEVPVNVPVWAPTPAKEKTGNRQVDPVLVDLKGVLAGVMSAVKVLAWMVLIALFVLALIAAAGAEAAAAAVAAVVFVIGFVITTIKSGTASAATVLQGFVGRAPPGGA
jgi:hypothetical protein